MGERELVQEWRKLQIIIQSQQWTRNVEMLRAILNLLHKKSNVVQSIHVLASVFFFFPPYFFPFLLSSLAHYGSFRNEELLIPYR